MKINIYLLPILVLALFTGQVKAQGEMGLFFSERSIQQTFINPAYYPTKKVHIALPNLMVQGQHDGFKFGDLIQPIAGSDSFMVNPENAIANMPDQPFLAIQSSVEPILVSFRAAKLQFTLSSRARTHAYVAYPKDLFRLAWEGNASYVGQTMDLAPDFHFQALSEIGLSVALPVGKNLRLGGRLKYLSGIVDISVSDRMLNLVTQPEYYQLQFDTRYQIQTSQLSVTNLFDGEPEAQFNFQPFSSNVGMGLDLGATYRIKDKVVVSASVLDLGSVKWGANANQYGVEGSFSFDGLDAFALATDSTFDPESILDSLENNFTFTEESIQAYNTILPTKVYLGATWHLPFKFRVGGLMHYEFFRGRINQAYMLNVNKDFLKFLTLGVNYSVRNQSYNQLGANILLKLGPVVWFMGSDNVISFLQPEGARYTNVRMGMTLSLK